MTASSTTTTAVLPDANVITKSTRLISLDVLRGLAVAGMVLVTDPGTYQAVYWPLLHAQWDGTTPTDMIFPTFLFAVGIAITFSFASRIERGHNRVQLAWHVLRRSVAIFLVGLLVNGFPDYNLHTLRIPGVLQRIAFCYLAGSLLYLGISRVSKETGRHRNARTFMILASIVVLLLIGYFALLKLVPVPGFGTGRLDSLGNLGAYIDRALFGTNHMWAYGLTPGYGVTYDPEGVLSTLPAIATLLIGVLTGIWLRTGYGSHRKAFAIAGAGLVLALAGWLLHPWFPINKKIWTSTFTLFSGGISLLAFSFLYWAIDIRRWRRGITPALVFGTNAILAFALSNVITALTDHIHVNMSSGAALTLHEWGYRYCFATWLLPIHASLAYAIVIVLLNFALLYPLYRRRIFLRF